jgi:transcriptional regulator with XRE-family HTH domain
MKQFKKSLIKQLLVKQHESKNSWNQLAKKANISPSIVSKFLQTNSDISVESLNKITNLFNVDVYQAVCLFLKGRIYDTQITVPVTGIANSEGIIEKPRLSDPAFVYRSNLWFEHEVIIIKFDPYYGWQYLVNKNRNLKGTKFSTETHSVITYKKKKETISVIANVRRYNKIYYIIVYPTSNEHELVENEVISIYQIESGFAPTPHEISNIYAK